MKTNREKDFVARARRFDTEAVGALYDAYFDEIFRYIVRRTGDDQVSYDIAADTFVKAFKGLTKRGWKYVSFRAYVYRIAGNLVADHFRSLPSMGFDDDSSVHVYEDEQNMLDRNPEVAGNIQGLLGDLKEVYSQVLVLRFWQDMSIRETAQVIGKSEGATKTIIHRALHAARGLAPKYHLQKELFTLS